MTDILPYFTARGTRRRFDPARHLSSDDVKAIVGAAAHAPNTGNMQLYTVVATLDPSAKKELAALHFNQPAATGADVLLTVCADTRRFGRWCRAREAENSLDNLGGRLTAAVDAAIVAQQIVTVAETAGLGTCYLGTATYNAEAIGRLLGLPKGVIPIVGIALGYPLPGDTPAPADRLPVDAVLHMERYHDSDADDIDAWYAAKEALPESARFIAENGLDTLAQVYSKVRYPRDLHKALGKTLLGLMSEAED